MNGEGNGGVSGRDRPKSWLSLLHPKRLFSACAFSFRVVACRADFWGSIVSARGEPHRSLTVLGSAC